MAELFLIRHGQASFGAANYDKLSPVGEEQARLLGRWWRQCGLICDRVVHGRPERQRETARLCLDESGGPAPNRWEELDGFGEFDHETVIARHEPAFADKAVLQRFLAGAAEPRRAYQTMFAAAVARWTGGRYDGDYREPWPAFRARVSGALQQVIAGPARRVAVFTSGGPITAVLQEVLALPDAASFGLNWPLVNSGVTRLRFSARAGALTLATYNAHPHIDATGDPALVTYR
jgi:broad specificity phosphatase PhoE